MASKIPTFCVTTYDEFRSLNGDNIVINYLVLELLKRKFPVEMVVVNEETAERCAKRFKGIELRWLGLNMKRDSSSRFLSYFKFVQKTAKVLSKTDCDIYFGYHFPSALSVSLARVCGMRVCGIDDAWSLYWRHSRPFFPFSAVATAIERFEQLIFRKSDILLTTSAYNRDLFIKRGARPESTWAVGIGSDPTIFRKVRTPEKLKRKYGIDENKIYIIYQGGIKKYDGVHLLVQAFSMLRVKYPKTRLLLIGQGSEVERLRRLVRELRIEDDVLFTGWIDQSELVSLMALSTVNVIPILDSAGMRGNMPYKLSEAMMLGIPTVVTDLPGIRELAEPERHCLVFEAGNVQAMAAAIERLLKDKKLHRRLSKGGKKKAMEHSWDSFTRKLLDLMLAGLSRK